jgi:RimJ/RimL family protein N-acetyltransferase
VKIGMLVPDPAAPMRRAAILLRRASDIARTEGLFTMLARAACFARRGLFTYAHVYLYEFRPCDRRVGDFDPTLPNVTCVRVHSNEEADELARRAGLDFRRYVVDARRHLDNGAIAHCIFRDGELAYIGWVGMSEDAHRSLCQPPYRVDFAGGEAFTAGGWTDPRYRRMGLAAYGFSRRIEFLRSRGTRVARAAVTVDNVPSQRLLAKMGGRRYAEGRHLRLLRCRFWREIPLTDAAE